MNEIFTSIVDTNRRWNNSNISSVTTKKEDRIQLWKNDYTFVQFFVHTQEIAYIDFDVKVCDDIDVELYSLESTLAFVGHAGWYAFNPSGVMPSGPKKKVEDILRPFETNILSKNEGKCYFAKVSSKDTVGTFDISIAIKDRDKIVDTLTIEADVLDISMPKPEDYTFSVEYWHHPYNVAEYYDVEPWSNEHLEILKDEQLLYKSLGGKGVICTVLDEVWGGQTYSKHEIRYPSMVQWRYSKGKWTFDYTAFDKWIKLNQELGLEDKFICYSMMPWGNKMRYYNEDKGKYITRTIPTFCKNRYRKAWRVFLEDFVGHLDELGIFDSTYIGFDERSNMKMILDFLSAFTNKDGHHFKVSASFNDYIGNRACLDRIDSASIGLDEIKAHEKEFLDVVKDRNSQGKFTSLYTATEHFPNSFALSIPAESYWSIIYAYSMGNNGFLRWAYDAYVEDPLVDTTHWSFQAGDCFLIYPNKTTKKPSLSYRLLKLDEGVRDVNKLAILSAKPQLAGRISSILDISHKNYSYNILYDPSWGKAIRRAKWADETSAKEIIQDVSAIKNSIEELSIEFLEK